jgi:hypothetical protein
LSLVLLPHNQETRPVAEFVLRADYDSNARSLPTTLQRPASVYPRSWTAPDGGTFSFGSISTISKRVPVKPSNISPRWLRQARRRPVPDVRNCRVVPAVPPAHLGQGRADLLLRDADGLPDFHH